MEGNKILTLGGYEISNGARRVINLALSQIAKDYVVVFLGNVLTAVIGFLSTLIVARILGPHDFGLFSITLAIMAMVAGFSDFGIGTGLVRFASMYLDEDREKAHQMFKTAFKLKVVLSIGVFIIGILLARPIASFILGSEEFGTLVRLAFLGMVGISMSNYINSVLQAYQSFKKFSLLHIAINAGKFGLIILLFFLNRFDQINVLAIYAMVPLLGFVIGMIIIPKISISGNKEIRKKEYFAELLHFSKWIMISNITASIMTRIDVLILSYYRDAEAVGIYSVGWQLVWYLMLTVGAITIVLIPKVSKLVNYDQIVLYTHFPQVENAVLSNY